MFFLQRKTCIMLRSITAFRGIAQHFLSKTRDLSSTKKELKHELKEAASKIDNIRLANAFRSRYIADPFKQDLLEGQYPCDASYWKNLCLPLSVAHANVLIDRFPVDLCLSSRVITLIDKDQPSRHVNQFYRHYFLMIKDMIYDPSYLQLMALEEKLKQQPISVNYITNQGVYIGDQPLRLRDYFEERKIIANGTDFHKVRSAERMPFDKELSCLSPLIIDSLKPIL